MTVPQQPTLREREAHLAAIFDHAAVGLSEIGFDGRFLRVNDQVCKLLGRTREWLLTVGFVDVTFPADLPLCLEAFRKVMETGAPVSVEKRYVDAAGALVFAKSSLTRLDDADGRGRSVLVVTVDLTERRRDEGELRLRSEQFETLLNQAPMGVFLVDEEFRLAHVNPMARALLDGPDDPVGQRLSHVASAIWGPEVAARLLAAFRRTLRSGVPHASSEAAPRRIDRSVVDHFDWRIDRITLPDGRHGVVCYFRDVSQQVFARRAVAESETRYRALFDAIDRGFCIIEILLEGGQPVDYRFIEVNPVFSQQTGLENALGRTVRELVPDLEQTWIETYGRVALTGEPVRFVEEAPSMGRWFDVYAFRVGAPEQRRVALLFGDITERMRTEHALRAMTADIERQRRLYDTIISSMPDLVAVFDASNHRFTFVNQAMADLWGQPAERFIGRTLLDVGYEPWHAEMHEQELARVVATRQPIRGEVAVRHATLGRRAYDYIFTPVCSDSGEVECIVGTTRDVTARQHSELQRERLLREVQVERAHLAELFEHAPSFMCELRGPDHVFVRANANYLRLVGMRDIIGRPAREVILETERRSFFQHLDQVFETGQPFRGTDVKLRFEQPAGGSQERWLDFVYQPLRDADGSIAGVLVQGIDLTERKRAEEALREADRRKDEFLATLAHELRNPLAAIRMAVAVLDRARTEPARLDAMGAIIDRQSAQLVRLIDDLLDVSRITRGKVELRRTRVDLLLAIEHAVEGARQICQDKQLKVTVTLPRHGIAVEADPLRFAQVMSNLVSNAAKFTGNGGEIRISAARDGDDAVVTVRDSGIGISPEDLPRVFDMFVQLGDPQRHSGGGLGIGLALASSLVKMHGGRLTARSDGIGRGAEFEVRLPILAEAASVDPAEDTDHDSRPGAAAPRRHILAVDDNADALSAITAALRLQGHRVDTASNGWQALERAQALRPEVILLDIGMPELDGYEVARRIRAAAWGDTILIVAMTGWGQERDRQAAFAAGFDAHLTKPANQRAIAALLARREELLEQRGSRFRRQHPN